MTSEQSQVTDQPIPEKPEFTDLELRMIFRLVRDDAVARGYTTDWTEDNRADWPPRLKRLRRIAGKIHYMRGQYPVTKP